MLRYCAHYSIILTKVAHYNYSRIILISENKITVHNYIASIKLCAV